MAVPQDKLVSSNAVIHSNFGKTVTPINIWQRWQLCSRLDYEAGPCHARTQNPEDMNDTLGVDFIDASKPIESSARSSSWK